MVYNNKATDIISEMREENLRDTFFVVVEDMRIPNIDTILGEIYAKQNNGIELIEYESYLELVVKVLKRDKAFIVSAIELFLSNRGCPHITWNRPYTKIAKNDNGDSKF
jgi:hypothetical protein